MRTAACFLAGALVGIALAVVVTRRRTPRLLVIAPRRMLTQRGRPVYPFLDLPPVDAAERILRDARREGL